MRRSPGSLCDGTWKVEKELPRDGLFSEDKRGHGQDMVTAVAFTRWGLSNCTGEMSHSAVIVLYFEAPRDTYLQASVSGHKQKQCIRLNESRTSWSDRPHQPVHLDVPVFDVGAGLAKFPLSSLSDTDRRTVKGRQTP